MPERHEPVSAIDLAAEAAFAAVDDVLAVRGAKAVTIFIAITSDIPEPEESAIVAGHGFEDSLDVFSTLLVQTRLAGKELGINVHIGKVGGHG